MVRAVQFKARQEGEQHVLGDCVFQLGSASTVQEGHRRVYLHRGITVYTQYIPCSHAAVLCDCRSRTGVRL